LYVESTARLEVDGIAVDIRQTTQYPWDGAVALEIEPQSPADFTFCLRLPGWCRSPSVSINGQILKVTDVTQRGYARIRRKWQKAHRIRCDLPMDVERLHAHHEIRADQGRVALKRGPVVYCIEAVDTPALPHLLALPREASLSARQEPDLLGGVATISGTALA